jgi:hypothetical protein
MVTLMPEAIDVLKCAIGSGIAASNLNDYALIYHKQDLERKMKAVTDELSIAIKNKEHKTILQLADEIAMLGHEGRRRIGAIEFEAFLDVNKIVKPGEMLTTHLPRLNQHLGGEPDDIDYEETGGFTFGEISLISGSTNRGKSCLATSVWQHFIRESLTNPKYKSAYFNYEGALERLHKTLFAHVTGVYPSGKPEYKSLEDRAAKEYREFILPRKGSFTLYDAGGKLDMPYTTRALESELSKLGEEGYRAFFIDTINSIDNADKTKEWEMGQATMKMLERIAARYSACVIVTAQNKQGLEFEDQKWPDMKWIASSAEMQRKPGCAIGIYRTDIYSGGDVDYTELAIIKARHRSPYPREGVKVSYDKRRRMYIPYQGKQTGVVDASEIMQKKQIVTALKDNDVSLAFGQV